MSNTRRSSILFLVCNVIFCFLCSRKEQANIANFTLYLAMVSFGKKFEFAVNFEKALSSKISSFREVRQFDKYIFIIKFEKNSLGYLQWLDYLSTLLLFVFFTSIFRCKS